MALAADVSVIDRSADAKPWREKTVTATATLRGEGARVWIRVVRPNREPGLFDNLTSDAVRGSDWEEREVSVIVAKDAEKIEYGVLSSGAEPPQVRDLSLGSAATKRISAQEEFEKTFSAEPWRGGALRVKAMIKLDRPGAAARLWMRIEQHYWYTTVRDTSWVQAELTEAIPEEAEKVTVGVTMTDGAGHAAVDNAMLQSAPLPEASPDSGDVASPLPPGLDLQKTIDNAAHKAYAYISGLPNFMCQEVVHRFESRETGGWREKDVLGMQLSFSGGVEDYKLLTVNDQPTGALFGNIPGAVTRGDFGSIVEEIFAPGSAKFFWQREDVLRGRPVYVFRFRVSAEKSKYRIQFGNRAESSYGVNTAYHGTVALDRNTGEVMQLVQTADPPASFPVRQAGTTVDYEYTDIGGKQFLLPVKAESKMATDSMLTRNDVEFRNYRKFGADSSISFTESKP